MGTLDRGQLAGLLSTKVVLDWNDGLLQYNVYVYQQWSRLNVKLSLDVFEQSVSSPKLEI